MCALNVGRNIARLGFYKEASVCNLKSFRLMLQADCTKKVSKVCAFKGFCAN